MPTFEVDSGGKSYEIDAPDMNAAMTALGRMTGDAPNAAGEGRSGAVSTLRGIPIAGAWADKAAAGLNAAAQPFIGAPGMSEAPSFSERYAENLPKITQGANQFEAAHPALSTAGQVVAGGAALAPLGATALGARALGMTGGLGTRVLQGGFGGAALGAADSAARGEDISHGAGLGGLVGGAAPLAGRAIGAAYQGARNVLSPAPRTFGNFLDVAGERVPLTGAQASGEQGANMLEQAALRGGMGDGAQQIARNAFEEQGAATGRANQAIARELAPGGKVLASDPYAAAERTSEAVATAANRAKSNATDLYKQFSAMPGEFGPGSFDQIENSIRQRLENSKAPIILDAASAQSLPNANRAVSYLAKVFSEGGPVTTDKIDRVGKGLVSIYQDAKANPADRRAVGRVMGQFESHITDAMDAGLFNGEEKAIQTWRDARAAFKQYKSTFGYQGPGDEVGRVMEKITGKIDGQAASPTQVANYLYGESNVGANSIAPKLAARLHGVLSPEDMGAVKQGLWSRLTQSAEGRTEMGPQKISERVFEFLNGKGKQLADVLLSAQERDAMRTYATALKQMVPPTGSVNYSNTAPVLAKIAKGAAGHLMALFGAGVGGLPGAMIGHGADMARKYLAEGAAAKQVARSVFGSPTDAMMERSRREAIARLAALAAPRTLQTGR